MDRRLLPVALIKQVLQRPARPPPLLLRSPIPHFQPFTCRQRRLESARLFSSVPRRQDTTSTPKNVATRSEPLNPSKRARRKKRTTAAKAPLAKIAKDAEVSHLRGVEHGSMRHRDPRVKRVIATCVAEGYDLELAQDLLQRNGMETGPAGTILYPEEPQVIHVKMPYRSAFSSDAPDANAPVQTGDIFVFPSGVVVAWGVPTGAVDALTNRILRDAAQHKLGDDAEMEDLEYIEDEHEGRSSMRSEIIVLGVKSGVGESYDGVATAQKLNSEVRTVLAKIAFSSGLARATKLSVLENQFDEYSESTRAVLDALRGGGGRFFSPLSSRTYVYGQIAKLLDLRAQLNLYSELTDDLPDLLWDARSELHMENYYDQVGRVLDTKARIEALNKKMDYNANIVHELRDMRSEIHSSFLEKIIIFLIGFEIALVLWTEYRNSAREEAELADAK